MAESTNREVLNWQGLGYAAVGRGERTSNSKDPESRLWATWFQILQRAKRGDFSTMPDLVNLHGETGDWILRSMCADLLGDAGTPASFAAIRSELSQADNIVTKIEYCEALVWCGRLSAIPLILQIYSSVHHFNDSDIIPVRLSDILESSPGGVSNPSRFTTPEAYVEFVARRAAELREQIGSDEAIVFKGKPFGVVRLAEIVLEAVRQGEYDYPLRRKFEAATGVDCSGFYRNEQFQPLSASSIVEEYLGGIEVEKYEEGVRYFFGHRIPD